MVGDYQLNFISICMSGDYLENDAVISDCGKYRYLLRRVWDYERIRALFIMLNPSTADAKADDPTIRSCVRLCKDNNFGSLEVVNLFGYRATDPDDLLEVEDLTGPDNYKIIDSAMSRCDLYIYAWGANGLARHGRDMMRGMSSRRPAVFCFGVNKDKSPKHPLYVKSGTPLVVFR